MSGIYIHIPFCKKACTYCDFHFSTSLANKEAMVKAICSELEMKQDWLSTRKLESIYFGGGTPSLLSVAEISEIMDSIKRYFSFDDSSEITLEVNPDDVTAGQLRDWRSVGINRLSIGLQSFNDEELKWMNRAHNSVQSESSVKLAQDTGFNNITIDLIYGSKFQDLESWEKTLLRAARLNTQHISAYNLTIENKTVLGVRNRKGLEPSVDEALSSKQFLLMADFLSENGFIHYEVSNFGKPGFLAVHNSNYWRGKDYLGLGPSAHSFSGDSRSWNVSNNSQYLREVKTGGTFYETEKLTTENRYNEYILTRLRTIWGCDINEMEVLFGVDYRNHFLDGVKQFSGLIIVNGNIFTLSTKGKLRADGISAALFV